MFFIYCHLFKNFTSLNLQVAVVHCGGLHISSCSDVIQKKVVMDHSDGFYRRMKKYKYVKMYDIKLSSDANEACLSPDGWLAPTRWAVWTSSKIDCTLHLLFFFSLCLGTKENKCAWRNYYPKCSPACSCSDQNSHLILQPSWIWFIQVISLNKLSITGWSFSIWKTNWRLKDL